MNDHEFDTNGVCVRCGRTKEQVYRTPPSFGGCSPGVPPESYLHESDDGEHDFTAQSKPLPLAGPKRFAIEVEVECDGQKVRHRVEGPTVEDVIALRNAAFPPEVVDTPHVVGG